MMGFDLWKVLQMLYHILQISKNTLNLQRDLKQLVLHCGSKSKSAQQMQPGLFIATLIPLIKAVPVDSFQKHCNMIP